MLEFEMRERERAKGRICLELERCAQSWEAKREYVERHREDMNTNKAA